MGNNQNLGNTFEYYGEGFSDAGKILEIPSAVLTGIGVPELMMVNNGLIKPAGGVLNEAAHITKGKKGGGHDFFSWETLSHGAKALNPFSQFFENIPNPFT